MLHIRMGGRPRALDFTDAALEITARWPGSSIICDGDHRTYVNASQYLTYYGMRITVRAHIHLVDRLKLCVGMVEGHPTDGEGKLLVGPFSKKYGNIDALLRHGPKHLTSLRDIGRGHALWRMNYAAQKAKERMDGPWSPSVEAFLRQETLDHYGAIEDGTSGWWTRT
ncbi:hypothetical protein CMK11_13920 [Candidatus Poribacteria bacterium]|nr:hypothetical protein [Candidatus Poribacteria bacterium]